MIAIRTTGTMASQPPSNAMMATKKKRKAMSTTSTTVGEVKNSRTDSNSETPCASAPVMPERAESGVFGTFSNRRGDRRDRQRVQTGRSQEGCVTLGRAGRILQKK